MQKTNARGLTMIVAASLIPGVVGCVQVGTQPMSWNGPVSFPPAPFASNPCQPTVIRSCQPMESSPVSLQAPVSELAPIRESNPPASPTPPALNEMPTPAPLDNGPLPSAVDPEPTATAKKWKPVRSL